MDGGGLEVAASGRRHRGHFYRSGCRRQQPDGRWKGHGPPSSRGPALVANDVRNEKLSRANVQERYGVVLKEDSFEVDRSHIERMRIEKATRSGR